MDYFGLSAERTVCTGIAADADTYLLMYSYVVSPFISRSYQRVLQLRVFRNLFSLIGESWRPEGNLFSVVV